MKEVDELMEVKPEIIAVDATGALRPGNVTLDEFFHQIKEKYPDQLLMADCSTVEEALHADELGFDCLLYTSITRWDFSGLLPQQVFDHWELNDETVVPKTSRDDNDPDHIQFYTGSSEDISRIDALKDAASAFVDATAVQNQGINEANQHRLSVVTFSDRGNVERGLTPCNDNNAQTIKNTIGRLRTSGNTYPGNAMYSAQLLSLIHIYMNI